MKSDDKQIQTAKEYEYLETHKAVSSACFAWVSFKDNRVSRMTPGPGGLLLPLDGHLHHQVLGFGW